MDDWVSSFDAMFEANKVVMQSSCTQWGVPNNSDDEINQISNSIQSVASSTGIDPRFILAIVIQESNGCVRAPTSNYGVVNPGLMQSHDGSGSCNNGGVQNPCPASQITQMITDGAAGTPSGDGLKQCIAQSGSTDVSMYYKAARIYNSGSIDVSKNLGAGIATHCYVSDVANRLTGWTTAASTCDSNVIGSLTGAAVVVGSSDTDATAPATSTATAVPTPATSTTTAAPEPTVSVSTTPAAPSPTATASSAAPIYPSAISPCLEYYTVVASDYCVLIEMKFGISASQFTSWNPGLDQACTNLWLGYQYCVKA